LGMFFGVSQCGNISKLGEMVLDKNKNPEYLSGFLF